MFIPKFNIELDKERDQNCLIRFFNAKHPAIKQFYPNIKTTDDVIGLINNAYKDNLSDLNDTIHFLETNIDTLNNVAEVISNLLDCSWDGIDTITINPCICPICPRNIKKHSFLVTYFYSQEEILRVCAHEMVHFLYFKKINELFPDKTIYTEYPSKGWLISEIVGPIIVNDPKLQSILSVRDILSVPDDNTVSKEEVERITNLYLNNDFKSFIEKVSVLND